VPPVTRKRPKTTSSSPKTAKVRPPGRETAPSPQLFSRGIVTAGGRSKIAERYYQVEAVQACCSALYDGGRGQLISACGTGKTVMCQRIAELLCPAGGVVVITCPSIALILQTLREWGLTNNTHAALAVCIDETAADCAVTVDDLPASVTTDPDEIASWLRRPTAATIRLIVSTHQSVHVVGEALRRAGKVTDLLIVDEAHRSAGVADKHTALVHHDRHLAARRRLYTTATQKVIGDRDGEDSSRTKAGMENEEIFGPVLYRYTVAQAIADDYLDDYRIVVMGATRREILDHLATLPRDAVASIDSPTGLHTAMVQTVIARAAVQFGLRRILTFCNRVNESAEFARTISRTLKALPADLRPGQPLYAAHIDGTMTLAAREKVLGKLVSPPGDGWAVVSNCRCLAEGVDVPSVDAVAFTTPKQSTTEIIQIVGRALRRYPEGSGMATIIVPILLPDEPGEVDEADLGDYKLLWQVLRALRAHDTVLGEALDRHRAAVTWKRPDLQPIEQVLVDLPEGYDDGTFLRYLNARIISSTTSSWWEGYGRLTAYHAEHGTIDLPQSFVQDGFAYGRWLHQARQAYRAKRLLPEQIAALNELGMIWEPKANAWNANLAALTVYYNEHGDLNIASNKFWVQDINIGYVLYAARKDYADGTLAPSRIADLEALRIDWTPGIFGRMMETLRAYYRVHGDIDVPKDFRAHGIPVRAWLDKQRKKRTAGELTDAQIAALDAVGMVWNLYLEENWAQHLNEAIRFRDEHGHLQPSAARDAPRDELALYHWFLTQRAMYAAGTLTPERADALRSIGFDLEATSRVEQKWLAKFDELKAFREEHGHTALLTRDKVNPTYYSLARWLAYQRQQHAAGALRAVWVKKLTDLGVDLRLLPAKERNWESRLTEAKVYYARYGSLADLPPDYTTTSGAPLDRAIRNYQKLAARGELAADRIKQLADLGVIMPAPRPSGRSRQQRNRATALTS